MLNHRDLKRLPLEELRKVATQIRSAIIDATHKQGGHVASNLGVVEITLGIAKVFDLDKDVLVFDTSHQSYTYKLITGRGNQINTIRTLGGISGFTDPIESPYDKHYAGHAGTGLSLAYGEALSRRITGQNGRVLALVGDGALTNGISYEALNNIAASNLPVVVVLNDNEHSISPNVGAIAAHLAHLRSSATYRTTKKVFKRIVRSIHAEWLDEMVEKLKLAIKDLFRLDTFFEKLGFVYLGPFDGNDIASVVSALEVASAFSQPVLVHFVTKKGAGYKPAEINPVEFHSSAPFDVETGEQKRGSTPTFTGVFGHLMAELGSKEPLVAITAAMTDGTGLNEFAERFPDRFVDVGIAEEHAVITASSLASRGLIPVVAVYSTFLQRAYDQIIHDVALPKRKVIFALDRAGVVPGDGPTHQGLWDISYALHIPGALVYAPFDEDTMRAAFIRAMEADRQPVFIRYPKASVPTAKHQKDAHYVHFGLGSDITLICYGPLLEEAITALDMLKQFGISGEVLGLWQVSPIPQDALDRAAAARHVFIVEEGIRDTGAVALWRAAGFKALSIAVRDPFLPAGSRAELLRLAELDALGIVKRILRYLEAAGEIGSVPREIWSLREQAEKP